MRKVRLSLAVLVSLFGLACGGGGGGDDDGGGGTALTSIVANVKSSNETAAVLKTGAPPAAASAVLSEAASLQAAQAATLTYLRGGTASLTILPGTTRVIIAIADVDGYWELSGLTAGETVLVTFGQSAPATFTFRYGQGDATSIAAYAETAVAVTEVGTGDVQVNVTWDREVDVDLHVLDPNNEEVYWLHRNSASGGALDLDSNPGCAIDGVKAENITWATGTAPKGTYRVLVDYFSDCSIGETVNYVVTVNAQGKAPQVFAKSFEPATDDGGSACYSNGSVVDGVEITTFTVE